jgi:predicted phosphoribosyltransferase
MQPMFEDRRAAGVVLAEKLKQYRSPGVALAVGAAAVDWPLLGRVGEDTARAIVAREQRELARLETVFRGFLRPPVERHTVLLIGDAIETGMRMRAALRAIRGGHPSRVISTAPVGCEEGMHAVGEEVSRCVCAVTAVGFHPRDEWYDDVRLPSEAEALGRLEMQARHGRLTVA